MADVVDVSNLTVNIIENNGSKTERTETPEEKKTAIENKNGALIYKEAFNGADLEYEVTSTRLKESIVVSEKQSEYSYSFDMNFDGLTPVIHSDGSIFLIEGNDTENPVFVIASPYMIDGNNEYSDMVEMRLTENGSLYTLIVTADSAWINSQDRAFPVVIDPTVIIDVGRRYIYDCYVDNSKPNKTFRVDDYLYAGMNGLGKTRTYVKYALPNLPDCSIVTAASLYLWQQDFDPGSGDTAYLNVYDCGDSGWNIDTITWNNQPISPSATVIDYTAFKANVNDVVAQYTFNITKIAKRWYEDGVNNGFMIASSNESVTKRTRFFSAENSQEAYPVTQIQYVNNTGIEDYWTYETIDLGRSGTAYISDYSGGLTYIHPNLNMSGYQMPLSISHVFNSDTTNSEDAYLNMRFGKSFRLNILERVIPVSQTGDDKPLYDAGYRYRLVDSDGTAHYYKTTATAGRFVHEFNDKNVLTKPATDSNNYYKITFEDGSGKTYGSDTCLRKITDKNGVSQTIAYAGGRITGVTDGAGRTATFTYNASNYLTSITDPAGRSTSFTYTDNWHLRSIVYPDGKATTFYYTSSGGKIAQIVTVDSSDILFTYKTVASKEKIFYRVTGAERRGKYESAIAGRQTLNKLTFQYRTGDTVVTDLNGNANYIIFDNAGRTIGTRDHSGALSTVRYNTIGNKNNKPDRSSDSFSNVFNLAENHSFERANLDYWTIYADSDYYTTGFLTSGAYMGHKALRLTMTQRGSVLFNQNFSNVSAGQKYTFSAYVKINGTLTNGVADLLIEAKNGGTILSSTRSTGITTTNNEWVRIQVNVTLPANCNLVRVYGAINNGTGTAYFDAVQMESGHAMNRYNLLENNGFNNVTSGNIDHWTFENCTSSDGPTINTNNNTNAARIYGNYTARKRVKQDVRINGKAGDTLVFGAWAKAACSAGGNNGTRKFGIIIDLYSGASLVQSGNAVFNEDAINSFQYVTGAITTTTAYDTVKYYLVYYNEVNSVIFENAHLYFDAYGSTY
ncbi:MAG TPA: DNRLRE domain-containing protein, partial [Clostridiales bacterium]|nr:DNRLRE domain-containing protein [Clostridiales bacterium]